MVKKSIFKLRYPANSKLWLYTIMIILLAVLIIFHNYQQQLSAYSSQVNQQIAQRNQLLALMQAQLLESKLEAIDQTLKLISSHPDFVSDPEPHTYLLKQYSSNNPEMQALLHVTADGLLRYPMHLRGPLDLSERDYFVVHQKSKTDNVFTTKPMLPGRGHVDPVMVISRGLYDANDNFQGVVAAVIDIKTFSLALSGISVNAQLFSSIVHEEGEIVFRVPYQDFEPGQTLDYVTERVETDKLPLAGEGIYQRSNGDYYQFAYQTLPKWRLHVFVGENRAVVDELLSLYKFSHLRNSALTALSLIILILTTAWLIGRRLEINQQLIESKAALQQSYQRNQAIIKAIPDLLFTIDRNGKIIDFEQGESVPLLMPEEDFINKHVSQTLPDFLAQRTLQALHKTLDEGESDYYEYELNLTGKQHFFMARTSPINQNRMLVVVIDITERKKSENALQWQATHDSLTQLPNRVLFYDRLNQAIAESARYKQPFCLLYIDLNDFKAVNDNYGHLNGDLLLILVAQRIRKTIRESDTAARLAGDEFAIIINHSNLEEAQQVTDKLRQQLALQYELNDGVLLNISASIGIACYPHDGKNADELISYADDTMYDDKRSSSS
ncbi:diguanylate cyclase domain-containing protein [Methylophaga sp.]|uniref:diguanylate cyclase domain-containing protein n=1 Tax=Methylophaga sp. TaxID=2024840 RepID=UPI003A8C962B